MNRTACIKLSPDAEQVQALVATQAELSRACAFVAKVARQHKVRQRNELHQAIYDECRAATGARAQVVMLAIARSVHAYEQLASIGALEVDWPWPILSFSGKASASLDAQLFR